MDIGGQGSLGIFKGASALRNLDKRALLAGRLALYGAMGLALAWARVLESCAPLGLAMVACSGPGISGACALAWASLGYLLSGGIEWGIRYVAAAVLVYTISFAAHQLPIYKNPYFMPSAAAGVMALSGFLGSFSRETSLVPVAAELFLEITLAFGGSYFFREALSARPLNTETAEQRHDISVMIMTACLLMSMAQLELFQLLSLGRVMALLLLMCSAVRGGLMTGAAVGTVLGLAMDAQNIGSPFYTMAYSFTGLLSGVFGKHGRLAFSLSFLLGSSLAVVCAWDTEIYLSALLESFCAAVIFMLLPGQLLSSVGLMIQYAQRGSGEAGLRRFVARRVESLSQAYGQLFDTLRRNLQQPFNDENIAKIYDRAADQVCIQCKHKNRCWNAEYVDTLSAMNDATQAMAKNGMLELRDLPGYFRDKCPNIQGFVAAVNSQLRGSNYRRQLRAYLAENRNVAWGQYLDVADILGGIAGELAAPGGDEPLIAGRLLRYLRGLDMDPEVSVYRDGRGRLRLVIECPRLSPLLGEADYLEKLSAVVGLRLCQPRELDMESSCLELLEAEPLAVSVGIAALKKRGERVSGDRGTYFKTDSGVLCVILADGMGTGDQAAKDSAQVVEILEKFLRSGVDPAVAMKILNSVLLLRGGDSWGYATVDLVCVDLFSGETCFYKYGAAPSYVKTGRSIQRIKCETLAAGLTGGDGLAPDIVRMRLRPGNTALIATDGVICGSEDGWIRELLLKGEGDMKLLARAALKGAERLYGAADDMTVVAIQVEERA